MYLPEANVLACKTWYGTAYAPARIAGVVLLEVK